MNEDLPERDGLPPSIRKEFTGEGKTFKNKRQKTGRGLEGGGRERLPCIAGGEVLTTLGGPARNGRVCHFT